MPWEKIWTERNHTKSDDLLAKFGNAILRKIESSEDGCFLGTYKDILKEADLSDNYYPDLYNDLNDVLQKYGISSEKAGRNGRRYWIEGNVTNTLIKENINDDYVRMIIKNLNLEQIQESECKKILIGLKRYIEFEELEDAE